MNNANTPATVVVLTRSGGRVFRVFTVTSLDEVVTVWKNHRGHDIGIFEDPTGKTGLLWTYFPEEDDRLLRSRW